MPRKKPDLPELPSTGRFWLDQTQRVRLASPGIQRIPARRRGVGLAVAILLAAALAAAMWLARR